jgi:hypothetical protein
MSERAPRVWKALIGMRGPRVLRRIDGNARYVFRASCIWPVLDLPVLGCRVTAPGRDFTRTIEEDEHV